MGTERRRFIRIRDQLVVTFKLPTWEESRRSLTRNISGSGITFVVDDPLREETLFSGTLKLPDRKEPIPFEGKVVWTRDTHSGVKEYRLPKTQLGIAFVKIDEKDQKAIDVYVRSNATPDPG